MHPGAPDGKMLEYDNFNKICDLICSLRILAARWKKHLRCRHVLARLLLMSTLDLRDLWRIIDIKVQLNRLDFFDPMFIIFR